ncbi:MAG: lipopolysaccharide heptosyltransferase II [candidate division Zixibacteria bacterium]|nr:lipopolysaccharide heptosyltransferase II [candidate division Zixibacteria bacterium]
MNPSKILVVRLGSLGDIVLTAPVTQALRQKWTDADIVFATKQVYEPLALQLPGVNRVLAFDPSSGLWPLIREVRAERFDRLFDLHANARSRLLALFSAAGESFRYGKRRLARMAMVYGAKTRLPVRSTVDLYLSVLERCDIAVASRVPILDISFAARDEAIARLREYGIGPSDRVLALAPGASSAPKRWPARYFAQLADHFALRRGMRILMAGSHEDRSVAREVALQAVSPIIDCTGAFELSLFPAVVARCEALVGNDSGPMHIAAAVGTPVAALFGPTHPCLGFAPASARSTAISLNLPCSPCSLHGDRPCRLHTHACMETLGVESVIQKLENLLALTLDDKV